MQSIKKSNQQFNISAQNVVVITTSMRLIA